MPTFIFLKGNSKLDQVRGANKAALESALKRHATSSGSSSSGAFSGKGQTLGGGPTPPDLAGEVKGTLDKASAGISQLDPQVKIFGGLIILYLAFWYLQG